MVLKKTNFEAINSGNTMKKRYFQSLVQAHWKNSTCIIKSIHNLPPILQIDPNPSQVETAAEYIDDGGLRHCVPSVDWFMDNHLEVYSLNKKRRWLLNDVVRNAVLERSQGLADELFKVTLVHYAVSTINTYTGEKCSVTHYYDSQLPLLMVTANRQFSTREDLIQKARADESTSSRLKKRQPGHNMHFRGLQRKIVRPKKRISRVAADNGVTDQVPEIRYSIAEAMPLNSSNMQEKAGRYYKGRFHRLGYPTYRPQRVRPDCCTDFSLSEEGKKWRLHHYVTEFITSSSLCEEEWEVEKEEEGQWLPPPAQQEWSLWDLAQNTASMRRPILAAPSCSSLHTRGRESRCPVNTASSQTVRKHDKGSTVVSSPHPREDLSQEDSDFQNLSNMEDDDSMLLTRADNSSSMENVGLASLIYSGADFEQFDNSFSTCVVPERELKDTYVHSVFREAVEIGSCVPFTARFNLHAVCSMRQRGEMKSEGCMEKERGGDEVPAGEWWLLCQKGGDNTVEGKGSSSDSINTTGRGELAVGTEVVRCRLFGGVCDKKEYEAVTAANEELQHVMNVGSEPKVGHKMTSLCELVDKACCIILRQSVSVSQRDEVTESSRVITPRRRYGRSLEVHLPYEPYTPQVQVCSLKEAYLHLTATQQLPLQPVKAEVCCSLSWCSMECSICFTHINDMECSPCRDFSFFIAMTCGHSFCRRCWQRHLVSSIVEGKTTLHCMEYKCQAVVDATTVMSLVPPWVFTRWQQVVQSRVVESSGEWRWCPNSCCGLLARTSIQQTEHQRAEAGSGMPVVCSCGQQWCLHCGQQVHWPLTCQLNNTYTRMLRQNGEEEGVKMTTYVEISSVSVKRCPSCHYPLEKNGGCSHMTCCCCQQSFCWVCLSNWAGHVTGNWQGCPESEEETIELENYRMYPLPVECYKKAVAYRYIWKELDREQHAQLTAFHSYVEVRGHGLHRDALSHVMDAFVFLKKGLILLEVAMIVLSHSPRRNLRARKLHYSLQTLHFICDRVAQSLKSSVKRVLRTSQALQVLTSHGEGLVQQVCRLVHLLVRATTHTGAATQSWLLQNDHERFVMFR